MQQLNDILPEGYSSLAKGIHIKQNHEFFLIFRFECCSQGYTNIEGRYGICHGSSEGQYENRHVLLGHRNVILSDKSHFHC